MSDRNERQMYEQYIEEDFTKRDNSYKKLKLLHTERRTQGINEGDLKVELIAIQKLEKNAQNEYLSFLQHQTQEKKHYRMVERNNQSLDTGRKYGAVTPEYGQSPAYLGLLPFETDRKRQLEVIDRKFGFAVPKYLESLAKQIREQQPRPVYRNEQNPEY